MNDSRDQLQVYQVLVEVLDNAEHVHGADEVELGLQLAQVAFVEGGLDGTVVGLLNHVEDGLVQDVFVRGQFEGRQEVSQFADIQLAVQFQVHGNVVDDACMVIIHQHLRFREFQISF